MPEETPVASAYLLLKNSLKLFQKPWHELNGSERQTAERQAAEEFRIQQLVLNIEESLTVTGDAAALERAIAGIRERFGD